MMPIPVAVVSHGQKSHIGCHFDHLDLRYTVVSLMMLSASHYTDINANGIT